MNDLKEDFLEESRNKNEQNCSFEEFTLKEPKENTYNNLNYFSYETQGETPNNENQLNIINKGFENPNSKVYLSDYNVNIEENLDDFSDISHEYLYDNKSDHNSLLFDDSEKKKYIFKIHSNDKIRKGNHIPKEKKRKMGRKRKEDNNIISDIKSQHNKLSIDNVIRKIKVKFNQFIIKHINKKYLGDKKLMKIDAEVIKDGSVTFNLNLLKSTIKDFLINNKISSKYKGKISNKEILERIEDNKVKEFLYMTYEDCLKKYFCMNKYDFFKNFGYCNENLYCNLHLEINEKKVWDELFKEGLTNHFLKKKKRRTISIEYKIINKMKKKKFFD